LEAAARHYNKIIAWQLAQQREYYEEKLHQLKSAFPSDILASTSIVSTNTANVDRLGENELLQSVSHRPISSPSPSTMVEAASSSSSSAATSSLSAAADINNVGGTLTTFSDPIAIDSINASVLFRTQTILASIETEKAKVIRQLEAAQKKLRFFHIPLMH